MKLTLRSELPPRKEYSVMFFVGVIVFFITNIYFGWNENPQSQAEKTWDFIWLSMVATGGIGMAIRSLIEEAHRDLIYTIDSKE